MQNNYIIAWKCCPIIISNAEQRVILDRWTSPLDSYSIPCFSWMRLRGARQFSKNCMVQSEDPYGSGGYDPSALLVCLENLFISALDFCQVGVAVKHLQVCVLILGSIKSGKVQTGQATAAGKHPV